MKRWLVTVTAVIVMLLPSVGQAMSEIRLTADEGVKQAEVWLDGTLLVRIIIAEFIPVWQAESTSRAVWIVPRLDGGMLRLIVR